MNNSEKYRFSDFTFESYEKLLRKAKEHHNFIFYNEINEIKNFALWRHDIDMSVKNAYLLSCIEKNYHVKATYFIHLHSNFYNYFEKENSILINRIVKNGHQLGLHLDCEYYEINSEHELEEIINYEKGIIEHSYNVNICAFSFHNPTEQILKFNKDKYCDLVNTYGTFFKNIAYASDSNGYWRHKSISEVLNDNEKTPVQILTHPEWWTEKISSPKERVWKCIDDRANELKHNYNKGIIEFGRENIDWE